MTVSEKSVPMLPKSVKVAGITYPVIIQSKKEMKIKDGILFGECDYLRNFIRINKRLSDERKEQTFIHELTHAIFFEAGIEDQDEDMVNRVGKVLYQVLKDNDLTFSKNKEGI